MFTPDPIEYFPTPVTEKIVATVTPTRPGRVQYGSTFWFAQFHHTNCQVAVLPGYKVLVIGRQGNTLFVVPTG